MMTGLLESPFNMRRCPIWAIPQIRLIIDHAGKGVRIISFEVDSYLVGTPDSMGVLHLMYRNVYVTCLLYKKDMNGNAGLPTLWVR